MTAEVAKNAKRSFRTLIGSKFSPESKQDTSTKLLTLQCPNGHWATYPIHNEKS